MKFLHTMIRVKDVEKSIKFYTELLKVPEKLYLEFLWAFYYFPFYLYFNLMHSSE